MAAELYTEQIGDAQRWLLITHGIYGAGANWRAIARKIIARRPDWGAVLVDLRQHGRSGRGDPPHTIAAAAADLRTVIERFDVVALAGHSFGGKVVLEARSMFPVQQTWLLDSTPTARPDAMLDRASSVLRVLELLERAPRTWARREDFVAAAVADGHTPAVAQWLAMNLTPDPDGFVMRLDPAAMRALLTDYHARDLWQTLFDPTRGDVEVVIAERSTTLDADARSRLAAAPPHIHVHRIAADHWLHIEAPDAVVELFVQTLPPAT